MFEIKGANATAACYATQIEEAAIEQIRTMCDQEFARGSCIAIMPDAHPGAGCTIGTTMTIVDKVVPNLVGVDIGCGMYTVSLGREQLNLARIDEACHFVPSGRNIWDGRQERFPLTDFRCYRSLKDAKRLGRALGTLGGGNHFIEIDRAPDGEQFLVVHSGSRNLGTQVATLYQNIAIDLNRGKGELFKQREALIARYKAEGRRSEIQPALKELNRSFEAKALTAPAELCWLYGEWLDDYLHDMELCQQFARRNRELIANVVLERAGITPGEAFHTTHNYIDTKERVLRKGAIAAHKAERVLIPINMRDGSIIATGRGNADWNWSAPHGAGRLFSRTEAKQRLNMEDFKAAMEGIYTTSVREDTLDEAPMAYKSIDDIIGPIADSVDIEAIIKPIYNFKA